MNRLAFAVPVAAMEIKMNWIKKLFKRKPKSTFTGFEVCLYRDGQPIIQCTGSSWQILKYKFNTPVIIEGRKMYGFQLWPDIDFN